MSNQYLEPFSWESEVRDSELDAQGIVNHSYYFTYMEHCRHLHLKALGFDFFALHEKGIDLVLVHCDLSFKNSLKSGDQFCVTSQLQRKTRLRLFVKQTVMNLNNKKCAAEGLFTITGLNRITHSFELPELPNLLHVS